MQWLYSVVWVLLPLVGCNKGHQMGMYSGEQSEETKSEKNNNISYPQGGFLCRCDYKCKECEFYCEGPANEVMVSREAHQCSKHGCTNCLERYKCKCAKCSIRSNGLCNQCCPYDDVSSTTTDTTSISSISSFTSNQEVPT